jgi:hypothetical protein
VGKSTAKAAVVIKRGMRRRRIRMEVGESAETIKLVQVS